MNKICVVGGGVLLFLTSMGYKFEWTGLSKCK